MGIVDIEMLFKFVTFCCLVFVTAVISFNINNMMIGQGTYQLVNVEQCINNSDTTFRADIQRRKLNRTHDGFNVTVHLGKVLDESYGARAEMCKLVDGGWKLMHLIEEESFIQALERFALNNTRRFLTMAGVDPPEFPLAPGILEVKNFVFDFGELPDVGVFGSYQTHVVILENKEDTVGCVDIIANFQA